MKKTIAALILAAAAATPALASDGSETVMHSQGQSNYVATWNGMDSFAFAPRNMNWQAAQDASVSRQEQIKWSLNDR